MLDALAPARRRLVVAVLGLVALAVVVTVVVVLVRREPPVRAVAQDRLGPVLLLPGYGGSTTGVDALAAALRRDGRDTLVVAPPGDGRGDLRAHAALVAEAAAAAVADGAPSVDVVGYSAGGVVARLFVDDLGGDALTRRVLTLAAPNHGTDLAALAAGVGGRGCPTACRQLAPDSDLLVGLNRGDEAPPGPAWVAVWTADDSTVVPPSSGRLDGAVSFALQDVCGDLVVEHADVPADPTVQHVVVGALGAAAPSVPGPGVCR